MPDRHDQPPSRLGDLRIAIAICIGLAIPPLLELPDTGWDGHYDEPVPAPVEPLVVDVNTAPVGLLHALPGVGRVLAERIAAERVRRPYRDLVDLRERVRGIGPHLSAGIAPHVCFR